MDADGFIRSISIAGACNRGIGYLGCLKRFEEAGLLRLERVFGVSIGSLIALCVILGYSATELLDIVVNMDPRIFKDLAFCDDSAFYKDGAVLKGKLYKKWVRGLMAAKTDPDITFAGLFGATRVEFTVLATCIHSGNPQFAEGITRFSSAETPDVPVLTAVCASMAIPMIFPPVEYGGAKFVDGGILDGYEDGYVHMEVISKKVSDANLVDNPVSYISKIVELVVRRISELKSGDKSLVVSVHGEDFEFIDLDMSLDDKITLYKRGYAAASEFLVRLAEATRDSAKAADSAPEAAEAPEADSAAEAPEAAPD